MFITAQNSAINSLSIPILLSCVSFYLSLISYMLTLYAEGHTHSVSLLKHHYGVNHLHSWTNMLLPARVHPVTLPRSARSTWWPQVQFARSRCAAEQTSGLFLRIFFTDFRKPHEICCFVQQNDFSCIIAQKINIWRPEKTKSRSSKCIVSKH